MDIAITNVGLDLGGERRGTDMGPSAIHVAGVVPRLRALGHQVAVVRDVKVGSYEASAADVGDPRARFLPQIRDCVAHIAKHVFSDAQQGLFPVVLGGDHAQAMGTVAGLAKHYRQTGRKLGLVWVDAHTDMNTPGSTPSGNIHGMPLAVLLGHGPQSLLDACGESPVVDPANVVILGVRDVDATELPLVKQLGVRVYTMSELDARGTNVCVQEAFEGLRSRTDGIHLSFDLDGVDPSEAPGVGTPVPGGLSLRESLFLCEVAHRTGRLAGMELVELNPTLDVRNQTGQLAVWLLLSALGKSIL